MRPLPSSDLDPDQDTSGSFDVEHPLSPAGSSRLVRAVRFFAWDGGLPLAVALIPFALDALGGAFCSLAVLACVFVPLIGGLDAL